MTLCSGVYLSLGGRTIPSNSTIVLSDIGTSSPNQLICKSDRKPCCQGRPQYGGWYYPNQSQILHRSEQAPSVAFHSDRDNNGSINLYRTSSNSTSPVGRFCCETMDATNNNHTLCVTVCEFELYSQLISRPLPDFTVLECFI